MESALAQRIREMLAPAAEELGYELVRVRYFGADGGTLQIMAETPAGTMGVDDCAKLSHAIAPILDVEDPITSHYNLEVSSPGIDRPLTRLKDYANWAGHEARIELNYAREGRKRFRGIIRGLEGEDVILEMKEKGEVLTFKFPFAEIDEGKLMMTDALVALAASVNETELETYDDVDVEDADNAAEDSATENDTQDEQN